MKKFLSRIAIIVGIITAVLVCIALGSLYGINKNIIELQQFWFQVFGLLGSWAAGIGAIAAAIVALSIADQQRKEKAITDEDQLIKEKVGMLDHSIAVTADMKSRVTYLGKIFTEGGRPLSAITTNCDMLMKRYEALYDREIFVHLNGPLVERIIELSGSLAGIAALVTALESKFNGKLHEILPAQAPSSNEKSDFTRLAEEIVALSDAFYSEREELERKHQALRSSTGHQPS